MMLVLKGEDEMEYKASLACQVRMNIRCKEKMDYQTLVKILKKEIPYDDEKQQRYILGFFEECYPSLIKKMMKEQSLTRDQIIDIFNMLPELGETFKFREAILRGEF